MHSLLKRQLKRHLGDFAELPEELQALLAAVDAAYSQAEKDRLFTERSLELTSRELLERNRELHARLEDLERTQSRLEQSLSLTHATLESTADGIIVVALDGTITTYNRRLQRLWDIPDALLETRRAPAVARHILAQLENPDSYEQYRRTLRQNPGAEWFDNLLCRDGRVIECFSLPQYCGDKYTGRVWSYRDITPRIQVQRQLQSSQARLGRAQRIARIGSWEWDAYTGHIEWPENLPAVVGLEPRDFEFRVSRLVRMVTPQWRKLLLRALRELRRSGIPFTLEHEIALPSGEQKIIRTQAEVRRAPDGRIHSVIGTVQDVTEIRQSRDKIQLAAAVFENSIEGVMVTDPHGVIQMVNPAFEAITGYGPGEVLGRTSALLRSEEQSPNAFKAMVSAMHQGNSWQGEIENQRKDGEVFPAWQSLATLHDDDGRVTHYVTVFHDISAIKRNEALIRYRAYHDSLTELPNRLLLNDRLTHAIRLAENSKQRLALLFIDLDSFKYVNDSLGHTLGDLLLIESANRIRSCLQSVDTVARVGGDEFVVIIENLRNASHASQLAEKLMTALRQPLIMEDCEVFVTASIGITYCPDDANTAEHLIRNAEMAMYRAKELGRNTYQLFTSHLGNTTLRRITLQSELRNALTRNEFVLHYQPQVDARTGRLVGVEALVRWQRDDNVIGQPTDFIPVAEETGLIVQLGDWVLRQACYQMKQWLDAGHTGLTMAVNISPRQFQGGDLADQLASIIAKTGIPPEKLELEITEGVLMQNVAAAISVLEQLARMGVGLSIDDFGTGYSSLSYLKRFPLHHLKIDKSFVHDITASADDAGIANSIIALGHNLGLKVVAEGVESQEAAELLRRSGCDKLQGFYFSEPVSAAECSLLLERENWRLKRTTAS